MKQHGLGLDPVASKSQHYTHNDLERQQTTCLKTPPSCFQSGKFISYIQLKLTENSPPRNPPLMVIMFSFLLKLCLYQLKKQTEMTVLGIVGLGTTVSVHACSDINR